MARTLRKLAGLACLFATAIAAILSVIAWPIWRDREELSVHSLALGEQRRLILFNQPHTAAQNDSNVIVVLDGEKLRHGFATAFQGQLVSLMRGQEAPMVIAIASQSTRDVDLRNRVSQPASWRPVIAGRAQDFDAFLIREVMPIAEERAGSRQRAFLFGHSLAGLYVLDFIARNGATSKFEGYAAFTPTFSHDLSILDRLTLVCAIGRPVLITIGLESLREDALFERARLGLAGKRECSSSGIKFSRHPGMIHQVSMLSGQSQGLASFLRSAD